MSPSPSHRLSTWLGIVASPMLVALAAAFGVAMTMLHDVAQTVRRSQDVRNRAMVVRARIAAEAALAQFDALPSPGERVAPLGGVEASIERDADTLRVAARLADGAMHWFVGQELAGAAPAAFGHAFATTSTDALSALGHGVQLGAGDLPAFDQSVVAAAASADTLPMFRRDQGVALMHLEVGTDADDFVFVRGKRVDGLAASGGLIVVPGHLWLEPSASPLEIHLQRDLVIVVRGNLYVGRSLRVVGGGRLLFATQVTAGATAFVDRDGNGRWSDGDRLLDRTAFAGPIEGAGSVYFGHRGASARIQCDAGIFVGGELHLRVDTRVAGPLLLARGITPSSPKTKVIAAGEWRFRPDRELVAGFVTNGPPRASLLRYAGERRPPSAKQPLYLSVPAR